MRNFLISARRKLVWFWRRICLPFLRWCVRNFPRLLRYLRILLRISYKIFLDFLNFILSAINTFGRYPKLTKSMVVVVAIIGFFVLDRLLVNWPENWRTFILILPVLGGIGLVNQICNSR